jgi:hypothetical protein
MVVGDGALISVDAGINISGLYICDPAKLGAA